MNGVTKRRENPAGRDPTQSPRSVQPTLSGDGADPAVAGFGSIRVELTSRTARATDSQNAGHGCVNENVLNPGILQELSGDNPTIGQEYTRYDASIPQLTPAQPYGRLSRSEASELDMLFAGAEVIRVSGFDFFPPLEAGSGVPRAGYRPICASVVFSFHCPTIYGLARTNWRHS